MRNSLHSLMAFVLFATVLAAYAAVITIWSHRAIKLDSGSTKYLKAYCAMNPYEGEDDVSGADND